MQLLPEWLHNLESEDVTFMKNFVLASGSLKEVGQRGMASHYPTVRLRLDRLIQKIRVGEMADADPYIGLIKRMAMEERLDFDAAKILIEEYKKQKD